VAGDLLDKLVSKPQRETAGSDSASRFDYQKNWAFCEMLQRHMAGADYLVAFEFHDDVVFLTPSVAPESAEFYQVKTARSATPRKLSTLTHRAKNSSSILGKLFTNFAGICSTHKVKVVLVSNVAFEFAGADLSARDLEPKYRKTIVEKLEAELADFSEAQVDNLHFMITGVSIDAMQSFLHGEAMQLFKTQFGEEHGLNVHSWVRLLQSEITRRNNYLSDKVASVKDLISKKCIGREIVDNSLVVISGKRRATPEMAIIVADLRASGWNSTDLIRLSKKMSVATADYTDATNLEAAKIVEQLETLLSAAAVPLPKFIAQAEETLFPHLKSPYDDRMYLAAMSVVAYHEKI
jgi:Cap4 dsDNA endonuclease